MLADQGFQAGQALQVTKSDTVVQPFRALYVGVLGDVTIIDLGGNSALFKAVPAGVYIWCAGTKVMSTGTTATNIIALN